MSSDFFKISKGVTLTPQASEPAGQNGDQYYNSVLNKFRKFENGVWKNLASDSSGFKNILTEENSKMEAGVADWVTYDDGAVPAPVDGTGGSATAITRSATTTGGEVLEDLTSLKIAKSAADGQGEGISVLSKTIERADRGKPFFVYFSYDATHANFVRGDLKVYAYDVTNSQLLSVYNDANNGELLQQKGQSSGVIFPQDTCTQVRLILHCASTNALAWNVFIDEVVITPQATITGPVMTDWESYTPTFGGVGTATAISFESRRVGSNVEIRGKYTWGTVTAAPPSITLPNGYAVSSTIPATNTLVGNAASLNVAAGHYTVYTTAGASTVAIGFSNAAVAGLTSSNANGFGGLGGTGSTFSVWALVPIEGLTAGASLTANDVGLQTISVGAYKSGGAITANTDIGGWTEETDNYQTFNNTTGVFTAPRSGLYEVNYRVEYTAATTENPEIHKNGTKFAEGVNNSSGANHWAHAQIPCAQGDTISVRVAANKTALTATYATRINIKSIPDFNVFGVQGPIVVGTQTDWVSYTPTGSFLTNATYTGRWRRVGDSMEVEARVLLAGATTATTLTLNNPAGYTTDTNKILSFDPTADGGSMVGIFKMWDDSQADANGHYGGLVLVNNATSVFATHATSVQADSPQFWKNVTNTLPATGAIGDAYFFKYTIPIVGWSSETRLYPTQRVVGTTYLKDVKASGTGGGTATAGSYQTRTLNTQEGDTGFCSLSSNQFTLQPGTYELEATAPAFDVDEHKAKIRNVTDSTDVSLGSSAFSINTGVGSSPPSAIKCRITITSAKTFELQHRVATTSTAGGGAFGYGVPCVFGDSEVYSIVKIDKIY